MEKEEGAFAAMEERKERIMKDPRDQKDGSILLNHPHLQPETQARVKTKRDPENDPVHLLHHPHYQQHLHLPHPHPHPHPQLNGQKRIGLAIIQNGIITSTSTSTSISAQSSQHGLITSASLRRDLQPHIYLDPSPANTAPEEGLAEEESISEQVSGKLNQEIRILDENDPLESPEYIQDILKYLRNLERRRRPRPSYMLKHRDINAHMRAILVDWLVEVVMEFKLNAETLYLTTNILDRFLSLMHVTRNKLQLVGVSAMLIASKTEELYPPLLEDFVYICDNTYQADELRLMEFQILRSLKFDVSIASHLTFCSRFHKASLGNKKAGHLANFLCELSLQEYHFLKFLPSEVAASALVLALHTLDFPHWDATLQHHCGYQLADLMSECIPALHLVFKNCPESNLQSIREKYSNEACMGVSLLVPKNNLPPLI